MEKVITFFTVDILDDDRHAMTIVLLQAGSVTLA